MSVEIVPDGWYRRDLEEIAQIRRGITYTAEMLDSGAGLPYVNMKSFLKGGGFNPSGTKTYSGPFGDDDLVATHDRADNGIFGQADFLLVKSLLATRN